LIVPSVSWIDLTPIKKFQRWVLSSSLKKPMSTLFFLRMMERAFFSSRKNWLTGACLSNRHSHSKGAALLSRQKMHFVSMVSIPLKQLKQVTFRGNITIQFNEVVFVVFFKV